MVIYPWGFSPILSSVTASAPYAYTFAPNSNWPSANALQTLANGARIIAAGVRVFTVQSATTDQGTLTVGCLPREATNFTGAGNLPITEGGFPYSIVTGPTQGANEFLNYTATETYPLRDGATVVYRPQDPLDLTFRHEIVDGFGTIGSQQETELTPFFVVGIIGAAASSSVMVEVMAHLEYTVADGVAGVVNTGIGSMTTPTAFGVLKSLFGTVIDTTKQGVTGGFRALGQGFAQGLFGGRLSQSASAYSSSDLRSSPLIELMP
jgi:hypothetical protein